MNESTAMTQQEIFLNLKKNGKDNVLQTIDNCIFVLEHDENLRGTIRFNVLTERDCIVGDVGWERTGSAITERDMSYLKLYFERHYHLNHDLSVVRFICDRIAVIHKGKIVELAQSEELFAHPLHPYTRALLSAIPQPDPIAERQKKLIVYDPSCHHYSETNQPDWCEIVPGHFVLASEPELEEYRKQF